MIDKVALDSIVQSASAARILTIVKTAVDSLTSAFVVVQDDFSAELQEYPAELRVVVPVQFHNAKLCIELTILSVRVCGPGICAADFALRVMEVELVYNVTTGDRKRLLKGIKHLFEGATEIDAEGHEDSLCFSLPPRHLDH